MFNCCPCREEDTVPVNPTRPIPTSIKSSKSVKSNTVESGNWVNFGLIIRIVVFGFLAAVISISYLFNGWIAVVISPPFSVKDIPNLTGKLAVVTGANTGIGKVTALELARKGATVIVTSRDSKKGEQAISDILMQLPKDTSGKLYLEQLDLSSLKDVKRFSDTILSKYGQRTLDILILNAGVMMTPFTKTVDGYELQFATNHLGHFLIVQQFMKWIKNSSTRVVTVSSSAHHFPYPEGIRLDQLSSEDSYNPVFAYGQSKLANVLFAQELSMKLKGTSATSNVVHPGLIQTELGRHVENYVREAPLLHILSPIAYLIDLAKMDVHSGALTQLKIATSDDMKGVTNKLFYPVAVESQPSAHARNITLQTKLWEISEQLVACAVE